MDAILWVEHLKCTAGVNIKQNCYCHRSGLQADQESASSVKQNAVGGINMGASFSKIRKVFEFMLISVDYFAISI